MSSGRSRRDDRKRTSGSSGGGGGGGGGAGGGRGRYRYVYPHLIIEYLNFFMNKKTQSYSLTNKNEETFLRKGCCLEFHQFLVRSTITYNNSIVLDIIQNKDMYNFLHIYLTTIKKTKSLLFIIQYYKSNFKYLDVLKVTF